MRNFAIFTGWGGFPIAIRADRVISVVDDFDEDENGNISTVPNGLVCVSMTMNDEDDFVVKGPLVAVVQELEACLSDDLEDWQRN